MSLLTKGIMTILFFGLIVALISSLPLIADHPLDPLYATAITIIFGYLFAWSSVFTAINYLLFAALATIGLELGILLWHFVRWIIGFVSRFIG